MNAHSAKPLRRYATIFAVVIGLQSIWLLVPELTRPRVPFFPTNTIESQSLATFNPSAALAAWIGWPRGDLWVDYAMAENAVLLGDIENGLKPNPKRADGQQISTAERAAALAPYDSRAWLILAATDIQSGAEIDKTIAQLQMSYYTAPNDVRLMPIRIQIATRLPAVADNDLQSLIENDLRKIVKREYDLKNSIAVAYRGASPAGRRFLASKLAEIDSGLLSDLEATKP